MLQHMDISIYVSATATADNNIQRVNGSLIDSSSEFRSVTLTSTPYQPLGRRADCLKPSPDFSAFVSCSVHWVLVVLILGVVESYDDAAAVALVDVCLVWCGVVSCSVYFVYLSEYLIASFHCKKPIFCFPTLRVSYCRCCCCCLSYIIIYLFLAVIKLVFYLFNCK